MSSDSILGGLRTQLDSIDTQILDLLARRRDTVDAVTQEKIKNRIPVYVANREEDKVTRFREAAMARGLDPEWAEDFLRMIMSASRANQSLASFPRSTKIPKKWVIVGGGGAMGQLYHRMASRSGHNVQIIEKEDWNNAPNILKGADVIIICVPIHFTEEIIEQISPLLSKNQILADFTSLKSAYLELMLEHHNGPVVGLHPMHGPDVPNLSKQLMVVCEGRRADEADWLIQQFGLWGMRIRKSDPEQHDRAMHLVQGLRHFVALLHASFMNRHELKPDDMLDFSSPIYRAELMMTGRIFAQDPQLYADIVFSDEERLELLRDFLEHHKDLADMVKTGDKETFVHEFREAAAFFGDFADKALTESGYLINRLADRFG
jgi:chorismate mutase/prephenate dehydrogenase